MVDNLKTKTDAAFKFGAGRYIQEPGAIGLAGNEISRLGKRAFILGGSKALSTVEKQLSKSLQDADIRYEYKVYDGYTTHETAKRYAGYCREKQFEVVVGAGGGRIMDLAKAIAHYAKLPVINIPTQAATCAAFTPMSVMYTKEGAALGTAGGNFYHTGEVSAVIVDETIMLYQPPRYAASGILDAMAKFIEIQNGRPEMNFSDLGIELYTAYTLAAYIYDILEKNCLTIYSDIENHELSKAVHDFLFINFAVTGIISGSSKALGQTALAHEMYYAARIFFTREALGFLHGEIVGTSLILQLYYNRTPEKIPAFKAFMKKMNMPLTLSGLGITETDENCGKIFDYLCSTQFVTDNEDNHKILKEAIRQITDQKEN